MVLLLCEAPQTSLMSCKSLMFVTATTHLIGFRFYVSFWHLWTLMALLSINHLLWSLSDSCSSHCTQCLLILPLSAQPTVLEPASLCGPSGSMVHTESFPSLSSWFKEWEEGGHTPPTGIPASGTGPTFHVTLSVRNHSWLTKPYDATLCGAQCLLLCVW